MTAASAPAPLVGSQLRGCTVRLTTTNGGSAVVNVLDWYGPSYVLIAETPQGDHFRVEPERIASVEHVQ